MKDIDKCYFSFVYKHVLFAATIDWTNSTIPAELVTIKKTYYGSDAVPYFWWMDYIVS